MIVKRTILNRGWLAVRLLFPTYNTLKYVGKIKNSGLFNRKFYLSNAPNLHPLARLFPERHYALRGETVGLCPNQNFSPLAYFYHAPDLKRAGKPPLMHYIDSGQSSGLQTKFSTSKASCEPDLLPNITPETFPTPAARFAIVVHIYYHDLWPEIAAAIQRQTFDFDLFITLNQFETGTSELQQKIKMDFPRSHVWVVPNRGRDIFPFVHLNNSGLLFPYQAICKLHTKKSPHRHDGDKWRQDLISGVLGDAQNTAKRLEYFISDGSIGFWTANEQHYQGDKWWGANKVCALNLLQRVGVDATDGPLSFPAGSIYWVKPEVLKSLRNLNLCHQDFEPEQGQVDGTTAHAIERCLGILACNLGLRIYQAKALGADTTATEI